ncbi:hypothetical protein SLS62_011369 [Diatrype stigma]|uniref:SnoaL-like polyketide cyclase n=1 Tax=Diatrype stigma TaxID=117547 RepID=A0AAN9YEH8_9PEZI
MASLKDIYTEFIDCLRQHRWEDLGGFLHPNFTKGNKVYTPRSFADESRDNGDTEIQLDSVTVDYKGQKLASTILVRWKPSRRVMGFDPPGKPIIFVEQHFNWFVDEKLSRTITMSDRAAIHRQLSNPDGDYAPDLVSNQAQAEVLVKATEDAAVANLAEVYRAYIQCINDRTLDDDLDKFAHAQVIFDGIVLTRDEFRERLKSVIVAIPDLVQVIYTIIADDNTSRLAAQLESSGTLVKPLAGLAATNSEVRFAEHCTYEFRDGKITRIWSLANWGKLGETTIE